MKKILHLTFMIIVLFSLLKNIIPNNNYKAYADSEKTNDNNTSNNNVDETIDSILNSLDLETKVTRVVTVVDAKLYAEGLYNYKFENSELRNRFFGAAENYLPHSVPSYAKL